MSKRRLIFTLGFPWPRSAVFPLMKSTRGNTKPHNFWQVKCRYRAINESNPRIDAGRRLMPADDSFSSWRLVVPWKTHGSKRTSIRQKVTAVLHVCALRVCDTRDKYASMKIDRPSPTRTFFFIREGLNVTQDVDAPLTVTLVEIIVHTPSVRPHYGQYRIRHTDNRREGVILFSYCKWFAARKFEFLIKWWFGDTDIICELSHSVSFLLH